MLRIHALAILLAMLTLGACKPSTPGASDAQNDTRLVAKVVARVAGRAIGAADVEERMAADGLDAETALQDLIDEEVLFQEAQRRGYEQQPSDERAVDRLMVRSLLRDFEKEITPASISEDELRADYTEYSDRMQTPERRRSWHILVKGSSPAARAVSESILQELSEAKEPRAVFDRYAKSEEKRDSFEVKAEDLPAIATHAGIEKPYKDALFAPKSEGLIKKTVETSYGWHVIYLAEIVPAVRTSLREAEPEIRERLSQKKRLERVVETVAALESQGLVHYDEQGVERLISMAGLPERAP